MDIPQNINPEISVSEFFAQISEVKSRIGSCSVSVWGVRNDQLRSADFNFKDVQMSHETIIFEFERQASLQVHHPANCSFGRILTIGSASVVSWEIHGFSIFRFTFFKKGKLVSYFMNPQTHVHLFPVSTKPVVEIGWCFAPSKH
jgi:hypothetical protein